MAAIQPGQAVWKTDDPELTSRLRKSFSGDLLRRQQPVDLQVTAAVGEPLKVTARLASGAVCELESDEPAREATKHPLDEAVLRDQLGRLGQTPFALRHLTATITGRPMLPFSVLGRLRHNLALALEAAVTSPPGTRSRLSGLLDPPASGGRLRQGTSSTCSSAPSLN